MMANGNVILETQNEHTYNSAEKRTSDCRGNKIHE